LCLEQDNGRIPPAITKVLRPECRTWSFNKVDLEGRTDLAWCFEVENADIIQVFRVYRAGEVPAYVVPTRSILVIQNSLDYLLGPTPDLPSLADQGPPQASVVNDAFFNQDQNEILGGVIMPTQAQLLAFPLANNIYQYPGNQTGYCFDGSAQGRTLPQQTFEQLPNDLCFDAYGPLLELDGGPFQPLQEATTGKTAPQEPIHHQPPMQHMEVGLEIPAAGMQGAYQTLGRAGNISPSISTDSSGLMVNTRVPATYGFQKGTTNLCGLDSSNLPPADNSGNGMFDANMPYGHLEAVQHTPRETTGLSTTSVASLEALPMATKEVDFMPAQNQLDGDANMLVSSNDPMWFKPYDDLDLTEWLNLD